MKWEDFLNDEVFFRNKLNFRYDFSNFVTESNELFVKRLQIILYHWVDFDGTRNTIIEYNDYLW